MSTLDEALEITGHGKFNHLALATNGFLLQYATTEALGLSYLLSSADCDLQIDERQRGIVSVATLIGVVVPAILWGSIGDAYGRRAAMLPPTVLAVLCSFISSLSQDFVTIFLFRLFTGIMVSASCATAYVYLGELTSPSHRVAAIAYVATFIAQAYITMPICAWILLPRKFCIPITDRLHIVPWRVLMWVYTLWGSAACVGMAILPESPAYTLATRGSPECKAILAKIYSCNQNKTADEYPVEEIHVNHRFTPSFTFALCHLKPMLQPPLLRCFVVTHICNFLVFMQSNTFYAWMPHIMHEMLEQGPQYKGMGMCTILNRIHHGRVNEVLNECVPSNLDPRVYPIATVVGIYTFLCYPAIVIARRRYGNKKIFTIVMAVGGVILLLAAIVPHVTVDIILYGIGLSSITASTVMVNSVLDVFPIRLRALAMSTLFMIGRLGAAVGSQLFAWGIKHSCIPIVVLITVISAVAGILMYQWPENAKVRAEMIAKDFNY